MTTVYDFSREWYDLLTPPHRYTLRSVNQSAATTWNGAGPGIIGPHTQFWTTDIAFRPMYDPIQQDVDAFVSRLRGRSGVARIASSRRSRPWYDRNLAATSATFSDGSGFTDGSGFANSFLPPEVYLTTAAAKGARYLVLGGLPASLVNAFRNGDVLEIKPNGIASEFPHKYKMMYGGDTNASGEIGVAIEPPLRQGVAAGDTVSLRYPSTLFRLVDDNQGEIDIGGDGIGSLSLSFIEALDLVP
jgi:hypothetical protein